MRGPHLTVLQGLGLAVAQAEADAAPLDTAGASQCQERGSSIDTDPKGTHVSSAPRADAPIIGRLAPLRRLAPETSTGVEFDIVGSKDGWLLIQTDGPRPISRSIPPDAADGRGCGIGKAGRHHAG